jgi:hypothetical protein
MSTATDRLRDLDDACLQAQYNDDLQAADDAGQDWFSFADWLASRPAPPAPVFVDDPDQDVVF